MSDKMMTPEDYLRDNPTALIFRHEISKAGQSTAMTRPGNGEGWKYSEADILIDWTGYTEPHVMIGPEFPQSRKREVEWTAQVYKSHHNLSGVSPTRKLTAENGDSYWQVGKYIDKPVKPEPELSRFLPVKWGKWRITQDKVNKGDLPFQSVELPDGGTCFRIGQYIDAFVSTRSKSNG